MLSRTVSIFLSVALMAGMQAWAETTPTADLDGRRIAVDHSTFPGSGMDATDDSTIYLEDFEAGIGDWTSVDVTAAGVKWHIDDYNGYNGTNSWWCADTVLMGYDNHWLQYLVTPELDFTGYFGPVLTFRMFHVVEDPAGATAPYDGWDGCNVWISLNQGQTWTVLTPAFPAYDSQSLYSFGEEWGMGPNIPGWTGASGTPTDTTWVDAQFNLAAAGGRPSVMIRFAFCSDPAYCTLDDPDVVGFFVDEVSIDDGANNLLYNDADGIATPSEFTFDTGPSAGDYWVLTTQSQHSGTNSMLCDHAGHYNLSDALVSPWLDIPAGETTKFRFWLWCYLEDFDGDSNNYLEDYYHVEVSTDESVWQEVFYDYGDVSRPGGAAVGWEQYLPGMPFNGNIQMDLSAYGGQQIKLRWRVITDGNDDGGIGDGLYIDDVELFTTGFDNDVSAQKMLIPMPTSAYFDTIHGSVELHNVGALDQPSVPSFWRVDGVATPLAPWVSIPSGGMVLKAINWTTPDLGSYFLDAYTQLGTDQDRSNDTSKAGLVEITPADVFEFGYDNRQYSYESGYYFLFDPGEGAYIRYTPSDDGVSMNISGDYLKARFFDAGSIRIHIYEAGTPTTPGPEVATFDETVTLTAPNWQTFDISSVTYLQNTNTDFWVFYEMIDTSSAHLTGNDIVHGEGHFFADFGSGMEPSDYDFFARAVLTSAQGVEQPGSVPQPGVFALYQNSPNPFNPTTSITFSLEKAGVARLQVFDLMGRLVQTVAEGSYPAGGHTVSFDGSKLASGIYLYRLEADGKSIEKKMLLLK